MNKEEIKVKQLLPIMESIFPGKLVEDLKALESENVIEMKKYRAENPELAFKRICHTIDLLQDALYDLKDEVRAIVNLSGGGVA